MSATRKWTVVAIITLTILAFLPLVFKSVSTPGGGVYYEGGRCICGHDIFIRIQGDGYFHYSPGHGVPEYKAFTIRSHDGEWEVLGLPHSDLYSSPLEGENRVIARLRIHEGALYESWDGGINWARHARVLNPYRVWIAKLSERRIFGRNES